MTLLDRYLAKTILASIALVTLMLAGLHVFILLVSQLEDLGKGDYGIYEAAWVVLLSLPYQVYLFFPVASLLGCLVGLGWLANHRELLVMRAAGMSIAQVTQSVFKAALVLVLAVTVMGETFIPRLSLLARDTKIQAISGGHALRTSTGLWIRHQNDFLMLGQVLSNNTLQAVVQFHFDASHHLRFTRTLHRVNFIHGEWHAEDVQETRLKKHKTVARAIPSMVWEVPLNPNVLRVSRSEPDEMNLRELGHYLHAEKKSGQSVTNYRLAYWQRIIQPATTAVMMLLAIPFVFGPLRESTMGAKLLLGVSVGFGFHLINRFLGPVSQVYQWPPELAAVAPTLVFAAIGVYLMRRVRQG
jgi:lipopolysaccharide export system permease protein